MDALKGSEGDRCLIVHLFGQTLDDAAISILGQQCETILSCLNVEIMMTVNVEEEGCVVCQTWEDTQDIEHCFAKEHKTSSLSPSISNGTTPNPEDAEEEKVKQKENRVDLRSGWHGRGKIKEGRALESSGRSSLPFRGHFSDRW
ncbi:hypothetical protein EDD85DRAFT_794864 [Armillaria nabsnona]|nr:hypothetical protein EDD85DRAFT_794864 [Armillaria nabsnona]